MEKRVPKSAFSGPVYPGDLGPQGLEERVLMAEAALECIIQRAKTEAGPEEVVVVLSALVRAGHKLNEALDLWQQKAEVYTASSPRDPHHHWSRQCLAKDISPASAAEARLRGN